jgi:hypothetical protein
MRITAGRKIAYVVDCAFTKENVRRIVALAEGADLLSSKAGSWRWTLPRQRGADT